MPAAKRSKAARTPVGRRRTTQAATGQAEQRKPAGGPVRASLNPADQSAQKLSELGTSSAMGRPAQPQELAPAHVVLAAPSCASDVSGLLLSVMGGPTG